MEHDGTRAPSGNGGDVDGDCDGDCDPAEDILTRRVILPDVPERVLVSSLAAWTRNGEKTPVSTCTLYAAARFPQDIVLKLLKECNDVKSGYSSAVASREALVGSLSKATFGFKKQRAKATSRAGVGTPDGSVPGLEALAYLHEKCPWTFELRFTHELWLDE